MSLFIFSWCAYLIFFDDIFFQELQERMEAIRQEEEEIEQAEKDARAQLAAVRKAQREEREARRKADLEKKKQDAIDRRFANILCPRQKVCKCISSRGS